MPHAVKRGWMVGLNRERALTQNGSTGYLIKIVNPLKILLRESNNFVKAQYRQLGYARWAPVLALPALTQRANPATGAQPQMLVRTR